MRRDLKPHDTLQPRAKSVLGGGERRSKKEIKEGERQTPEKREKQLIQTIGRKGRKLEESPPIRR